MIVKLTKLIIGLLFSIISMSCFAEQIPPFAIKVYGNITPSQQKLITRAFLYLNQSWSNQGKNLSRHITAEYFTPDTSLIINGRTIYTGYDQLETHFREVSKSIIGKIRLPLLEVIGTNNRIIVQFEEDIHDANKNYYPANVMAIFTFRDNKIQQWEEVAYTKYFCQAESASVVYAK